MKKKILLTLLCALLALPTTMQAGNCSSGCSSKSSCCPNSEFVDVNCECCDCTVSSHTFFSVRPLFQVASPERESLFHDRIYADKEGHGGAFQVVFFGSESFRRGSLGKFFTPFCKTELVVDENPTTNPDIIAEFFNIYTVDGDFHSVIQIAPKQSVVGVGFHYKQVFGHFNDGREFWFGISTPLTRVKNSAGLAECVVENGGGALPTTATGGFPVVGTMTDAFKQSTWDCGKIDCSCEMSKVRLADITLELGFEVLDKEHYHGEFHIGLLIPTGNEVTGKFLFEPIVGHNRHVGFQFGNSYCYEFWESEAHNTSAWFQLQVQGMFLFQRTEQRLVDLNFKPWSRYMPVYINQEQAELAAAEGNRFLSTPGVNVFCQKVCVKPGFQRTYNSSFMFYKDNFDAEIGYNFFARPAECVKLACPWVEGPALKGIEGRGFTNSVQMINNVFGGRNGLPVADYAENIIKETDLDLRSAAHPSTLTHTFFAAFGYHDDDREHPFFVGGGGSYEYSNDNTGLNRWVLWAKGGLSF